MADFEKIKDFIIDPSIREARAHVEVKRAMNPCPIDFSQFQSTNPRSNGIDKEYGEGEDASNFNIARKKYDDDEEPQFTASFGSGKGQLPVEPGRYRLIWSRHCPWANRIAIAIDLLGLDIQMNARGGGFFRPIFLPAANNFLFRRRNIPWPISKKSKTLSLTRASAKHVRT